MTDSATVRSELEAALLAYDRATTVSLARRRLEDGTVDLGGLYDLLSDVLIEVGSSWQTGETEVWQEHLVTGIVRSVVEACAVSVEAAAPSRPTRTVLLAAPEEEYHDLGLRMLADRFTLAGWHAHFLGANVPAAEVIAAVDALDADAVALAASTHLHRLCLREYVARITATHPNLRVWVGGSAFAHDHGGWPQEAVLDPHHLPPAGAG